MKQVAIVIGLVLGLGAAAQAGFKTTNYVEISSGYAHGSLASARNSPDGMQYLECSRITVPGTVYVNCFARDASGKSATCATMDPTLVAEVRTIKGDSYLQFGFDAGGSCTRIDVIDGSQWAPKYP